MDKPMSDFHFRFMSLLFKFRDFIRPRKAILDEIGIKPGLHILDYGCGPGSYSVAAAEMVGPAGKIYSLDIHPFAIESVKKAAAKKDLKNIETISSDCVTGLPDSSIDVVLLADVFHGLSSPDAVLQELRRVLKPEGVLAFNDHHLKEDEITAALTGRGLFRLSKKGESIYCFMKS